MSKPYLEQHPPKTRQFRKPRRAKPSGVIVVHTAESVMDTVGPDTGAENVAGFIRRRDGYGSYHLLVDSDSWIQLVAFDAEAYGDGTGSNTHAMHLSFACSAADWPKMSEQKRAAFLDQAADAVAGALTWLAREHKISAPLSRITRADSEARNPGFISHGERDPGRRTDPGNGFPWDEFFAAVAERMADPLVAALRRHLRGAALAAEKGDKAKLRQHLYRAAIAAQELGRWRLARRLWRLRRRYTHPKAKAKAQPRPRLTRTLWSLRRKHTRP